MLLVKTRRKINTLVTTTRITQDTIILLVNTRRKISTLVTTTQITQVMTTPKPVQTKGG
jgi:hypothetical protein